MPPGPHLSQWYCHAPLPSGARMVANGISTAPLECNVGFSTVTLHSFVSVLNEPVEIDCNTAKYILDPNWP